VFRYWKERRASIKKDYFRLESYSQLGEDRAVAWALDLLGIAMPTYLDIGANHPRYLSNTYLFYKKGCWGVCIEPNPVLCKKIKKRRKRDVCIQAGVLPGGGKAIPFFIMSEDTLSTFSEDAVESFKRCGYQVVEKIEIPVLDVNMIIKEHFDDRPDFISIDVEGRELEIVKSMNCRPPVWCVETVEFENIRKDTGIIEYFASNGYLVFADTFLNTIFVDQEAWKNRRKNTVE